MSPRRPTALPPSAPGPAPAGSEPRRFAPTRLPPAPPPTEPPRAPVAPTRVLGASRPGLEVPLAALQQRFPGLRVDEAEHVQALLRGVAPDALSLREAAAWGTAAQQRYGELVEHALQLGQDRRRLAAQDHLARLHALLQDVSEAISDQLAPGLLSRWRASPWELLGRHRAEIEQLRIALRDGWQALAQQRDTLAAQRRELNVLAGELQAWGLAATWLAEHLHGPGTHAIGLADTLLRRAGELTALQAQMVQAQPLREQADADLDALCGAIQQAVLTLLPAWLEKALHADRGTTPTAARELHRDLQGLLHALPARRD